MKNSIDEEFIVGNQRFRNVQITLGFLFIVIAIGYLIAVWNDHNGWNLFITTGYFISGIVFIIQGFVYSTISLKNQNNILAIKWNTFKTVYLKNEDIESITITKFKVVIVSTELEPLNYNILSFENFKKAELKTFLKRNYSEKLEISF